MRRSVVVSALLVVSVFAVYAQVAGHEFLEFDDGLYITQNAWVQEGLTVRNVGWSLVTLDAHIWHPLTWLSYLVDAELWGIERPGPWLLTNVAWHAAAALALFAALLSLSGRFWPSAFAAALFALHPIQTEPVAWASGRKELMSGCLLFVTLWLYARYARRRDSTSYAAVGLGMLACLSAKGTHLALPFLLLLLDYWPLRRLRFAGDATETPGSLVLEKLPLLGLCLAVLVLQIVPVSGVYGPWVADPPLLERAADGVMAYAATLGRLFWPDGLAIIYPTRVQMGLPRAGAAVTGALLAGLAIVTALAAAAGPRRGYLLVGWLWFLGMLFPMIGLVPSGMRVMHDRYAYVPMVGIALAIGFAAEGVVLRWRPPRALVAALALAVLALAGGLAWKQAGVWRDSLTLFDHALAVTERNAIVHFYRGNTLAEQGDFAGARTAYETAIAIYPPYPDANEALGRLHLLEHRGDLALPYFEVAVQGRPAWTDALLNLGTAQWSVGARSAALQSFEAALASDPNSEPARELLASARQSLGGAPR